MLLEVIRSPMKPLQRQTLVHSLCVHRADVEARVEGYARGGWNALHLSSFLGCVEHVETLLEFRADIKAQISARTQRKRLRCSGLDQWWYGGATPLMCAAGSGKLQCVELFFKQRADCSIMDVQGRNWTQVANGSVRSKVLATESTVEMHANSRAEVLDSSRM